MYSINFLKSSTFLGGIEIINTSELRNSEMLFSSLFSLIKKGVISFDFSLSNLFIEVVDPLTIKLLMTKLEAKGNPNQPHPNILISCFNVPLN